MKRITTLIIIIVIPLIGLSQKLSIGESQQSNGKQLLTMGNGEYHNPNIKVENIIFH